MGETVIQVSNLSKQYRLGTVGTGTLTHDLNRWIYRMRGKEDPYLKIGESNDRTTKGESDYVWALRDVNFEVSHGQVLGIIGRNGAGKSTLLKILSRTTVPSSGTVKIKGRIASLLEVGTGFHPELTGRENIYLNGAIMGMSKKEINSKFDEIVDFAGVERYIDTPVKRYSSGMYVRLAFAVAAHLEPDILIVDEVLAVGDAEFQKKCLGKMKDVSEKDGRTVLFVSHQMDAISRLCDRAMILERGGIFFIGAGHEAVIKYSRQRSVTSASKSWLIDGNEAPGNSSVRLREVKVCKSDLSLSDVFSSTETVHVLLTYEVMVNDFVYTHGMNLFDSNGLHILTSHDVNLGKQKLRKDKGIYQAIVSLPPNFLAEGSYSVSVAIMSYTPYIVHFHEMDAVSFTITDTIDEDSARGIYGGKLPGIVRPILDWGHKRI